MTKDSTADRGVTQRLTDNPKTCSAGRARRVLGVRQAAWLETLLILGVSLVLDSLFLDGARFWHWTPHPFWVLIILMSGQYGTREGLVTAALCSLALLVGNIPQQAITQDLHAYALSIARLPLLWCTAAILLGALRDRHIAERNQLRTDLDDSRYREGKVAAAFEQVSLLKKRLESRLVGQMQTTTTLYKTASAIEALHPDAVLPSVLDVLRSTLHPERFSLFLLQGDRLELAVQSGWQSEEEYSRFFADHTQLFQSVVGEHALVCVTRDGDETILGAEGVLAGPLIDPESGDVIGMLKIERIDFANLNLGTLQTFGVVSEWVASLYRNAQKYETARSQSMVSDQTELFSFGFFRGHKDFFVDLARRMGFQLSLLVVRLESTQGLTLEELKRVSAALKEAVSQVLRKTDLAFDQERTGHDFAIVLPGASVQDAEIVARKLAKRINASLSDLGEKVHFICDAQPLHQANRTQRMLTRELFEARLDFVLRLQTRTKLNVILGVFELVNTERISGEDRSQALGLFRTLTFDSLHETEDLFFGYQRSQSVITVVMPGASLTKARKWSQQLKRAYKNQLGGAAATIKFSLQPAVPSTSGEGTHVDESWQEAKKLFAVAE